MANERDELSNKERGVFGTKENAKEVFQNMYAGSEAYRALLDVHLRDQKLSLPEQLPWDAVPILTKKNFYAIHPWQKILPRASYRDVYSILRSSGTTAADGASGGFFWPQLKSLDLGAGTLIEEALRRVFKINERSTLAIIGLSLGSWAGGEQFSFELKSVALRSQFPFVVFSPGNQHGEILELIAKCGHEFEQILIALCPSAIFYLEKLAVGLGTPLPMGKISFLVTGEPFPESMRIDLESRSERRPAMLSIYGSADTGLIGLESPPLVEVRRYLEQNAGVAAKLGFASALIPNLYHLPPSKSYFEIVDGELVITKWQGLPLVRYNLEDRVEFFPWAALCNTIADADPANVAKWRSLGAMPLPDVLSVTGRSKGCLFLCGSNIFETMLQAVILQSSASKIGTGAFVVWTELQKGQQVLCWQIELKENQMAPADKMIEDLHAEFVTQLSALQPEFADDYARFYAPFESDGLRIFKFFFSPHGTLSEHPSYRDRIKKKIILASGPLV